MRLVGPRRPIVAAIVLFAIVWIFGMLRGVSRELPEGVSAVWPERPAEVEFLHDLTFRREGVEVREQQIFQRIFDAIDRAERFVVVDMFLFDDAHGGERAYLPLSRDLADRLVARKEAVPELHAIFITDEINDFYGAYRSDLLADLEAAGVTVVVTDLTELRDSNPAFSSFWRATLRWFGSGGPGWLPHPFTSTGRRVTLRSYLKILNFKANHRKVIVTDRECLVTSANPHDASSFHSNIAWVARGPLCGSIVRSEAAVARFSGARLEAAVLALDQGFPPARPGPGSGAAPPAQAGLPSEPVRPAATAETARARFLTEGAIERALLAAIDGTRPPDSIDIAMFYLSDRDVVESLLAAGARGVTVRLVLDPNKDAFGRQKDGIPNRSVGWELVRRSGGAVRVRWYDTHGEQFHTKLVVVRGAGGMTAFGGSANLTRRNLGDYNLEADLEVRLPRTHSAAREIEAYFERIWRNQGGHHTVAFDAYRDESLVKRLVYRVQEATGLCSY